MPDVYFFTVGLMQNAAMAEHGRSNADIARRLIALRDALGFDGPAAFARHIGILPQALNNYERAYRRPDLDMAYKLKAHTGVTLDWLYEGDRSGLPLHVAKIIPDQTGGPAKRA